MRIIILALLLAVSYCLATTIKKEGQQFNHQYHNNNPYFPVSHYQQPVDWVRCNLGLRPTVITTSTWTVTVTCTVSNAAPCRRKRQEDEDAIISPTSVTNRIDPTVETKLESIRKERQLPFVTDSRPYELGSTLMDGPYLRPYTPSIPYMPIPVAAGAVGDRFFFRPVTKTSTTFTVSTFTSRPSCSKASDFAQCP